jgi:excisionase family DNA binding protein
MESTEDTAIARPRSGKTRTYLPAAQSSDDLVDFAKTVREIEAFLSHNQGNASLVAPDGRQRSIPAEIFEVLEQVANALANGNGVTVVPYGMQLTTQEAADFLRISRPTLVKLLEAGTIAHDKRGRHRRVTLRDLVDYQDRFRTERRDALHEIAREGQGAGLPTEPPPVLKRLMVED